MKKKNKVAYLVDSMQYILTPFELHQFSQYICLFQLCPQGIRENLHHVALELLASLVKSAQLHPTSKTLRCIEIEN